MKWGSFEMPLTALHRENKEIVYMGFQKRAWDWICIYMGSQIFPQEPVHWKGSQILFTLPRVHPQREPMCKLIRLLYIVVADNTKSDWKPNIVQD